MEDKRQAYDPEDVARCGAFVILNHDGTVRIERGFVRPEDEKPQVNGPDNGAGARSDDCARDGGTEMDRSVREGEEADDGKPLSDNLIRDLTAHRTLGLRLALAEQPDIAVVAVTHALVSQIFYRGAEVHVLDIRPSSTALAAHADGIEDTQAGKARADRHANWARQVPRETTDLWEFIVALDHHSRVALFAHCVAWSMNAVILPWERRPRAIVTADKLASAIGLDMTAYWRPTVQTYLGRVTKANILAAVSEAVSGEAAEGLADLKKHEMAEAAEQLLVGTGWLPDLLRTPQPEEETEESMSENYSVAAE